MKKECKTYERVCKLCGRAFQAKHASALYCSDDCKNNAYKALAKERRKSKSAKKRTEKRTAVCPTCGKVFVVAPGKCTKYCGTECRAVAVRQQSLEYSRRKKNMTSLAYMLESQQNTGINDVINELNEYNAKHGTRLSYGQYQDLKYRGCLKK